MTSVDFRFSPRRTALLSRRLVRSRAFTAVLLLLLALDAILIGLHIAAEMMRVFGGVKVAPSLLVLTRDWSLGEVANYAKWAAIIVAMAAAWHRAREALFLAMLVVFVLILADDMLQVHERLGGALASSLGLRDGLALRAQDSGEMMVWAVLGAVSVVALTLGFVRSSPGGRAEGTVLIVLLGLLSGFAVGLDMFSIAAGSVLPEGFWSKAIVWTLYLVEDGGEMVLASVLCAAAAAIAAAHPIEPRPQPVRSILR